MLTTNEAHFLTSVSGDVYTSGPAKYEFFSRNLAVFDEVVVLARVSPTRHPAADQQRADGPGVSFRALPDHTGPWQYLRVRRELQNIARRAIADCDAYFLRMPGLISQMVWKEVIRAGKPYAIEIVGDPWDALGPGSGAGTFGPILRIIAARQMRSICANAMAICYVTGSALQRRYPPHKNAFIVTFSEALMEIERAPQQICEERQRRARSMPWTDLRKESPLLIGFVGTFSRLYKAPDVLLRALANFCSGLNFRLRMVGEGRYLGAMRDLAIRLGIADRVQFLGQLPHGRSISDFLDSIDLFVLPSRAEGLPHALLEAMSRGCPCIASTVGGIPDVLEASNLVPPDNSVRLATLILEVARDPDRLVDMSAKNLEKSKAFTAEKLNASRREFLNAVKTRSLRGK